MSKVGIPPPHNLDNPHAMVASINNKNIFQKAISNVF